MEKAGMHWLELRDLCTHFFHVAAKFNASRSKILGMLINDNLYEDEDIIENQVYDN